MKLDETLAKMTPEERAAVVSLLRGKANMHRSLLASDCEERIRKAVPKEADKVIKAMHMICDAMTRTSKTGQSSTVKAEAQDRYHSIAEGIVEVIEEGQTAWKSE